MPETLANFAAVNDAAAATTKKLAKQAILADYFKPMDEADLRRAVRFAAGRAFASTDERTLNVGGAIMSDVALSILPVSGKEFHDLIVRSGEIGGAISKLWPSKKPSAVSDATPITLADLVDAFDQLANTGNVENKKSILFNLFHRCTEPREAAYLAKIIFGDLRTGVQEGVLQSAIAIGFGCTLAAVQRCQLLAGDLDEVAELAKNNALDTARFKLFHPIQFMLAVPQETAVDAVATLAGKTFFAQDKLDGIRAQVHKQGDRIAIFTRTMDRTDESFPDVVAAIAQLPGDLLLDGEIVPYRDGVVLAFANIQKRLGRKTLTPKLLRDHPATFIAFDILYRDGDLLMDKPWQERHTALQALPVQSLPVVPVSSLEDIELAFEKARLSRNEGLILKDPESIYSPGRRGKMWLKLKTHLPTFDCVVTAAEYGHGKRKDSLSDYTFAVWDRDPTADDAQLVNVGKAYSGVTDEEIAQLTKLFLELSESNNGRVHRVPPQVVLEIACDQVQKSDRHRSGYAFRFPRIKRIRWDKKPIDADTLQRVAEVYEGESNFGRRIEAAKEPTLFDHLPE